MIELICFCVLVFYVAPIWRAHRAYKRLQEISKLPTARALSARGDRDAHPLVVYCSACGCVAVDDPGQAARDQRRATSYRTCYNPLDGKGCRGHFVQQS